MTVGRNPMREDNGFKLGLWSRHTVEPAAEAATPKGGPKRRSADRHWVRRFLRTKSSSLHWTQDPPIPAETDDQ